MTFGTDDPDKMDLGEQLIPAVLELAEVRAAS